MAVFSGNGSAGSPSFTFSSDTDSGIFRGAANTVSISAAGEKITDFFSDGSGDSRQTLFGGDLDNTSASTSQVLLRLSDRNSTYDGVSGTGDWRSGIQFLASQANGSLRDGSRIEQAVTYNNFSGGVTQMRTDLIFKTRGDAEGSGDNASEKLRITHNGYIRLSSAVNGIQFNGDTSGADTFDRSAASLSDYEEGTWTVTLTGVTGNVAGSGRYIRIGDLAHVYFTRTSTGAQTFVAGDPVEITGWPFSSATKAGNIATICVNVKNQNSGWGAVNQGIRMFNMVFVSGGNTARLYNMSTGAVVTYGDLYLDSPQSGGTNPAIRGYVVVDVS